MPTDQVRLVDGLDALKLTEGRSSGNIQFQA
jgi:hypothetical protein